MFENILADSLNGFSLRDLPFLLIQLSVSALIAWTLRTFWLKVKLSEDEDLLTSYLIHLQVVFTLVAIFAIRSPWMAVLFGLFILIIALSGDKLSIRSRVFFTFCMMAAWGCGAANLFVTAVIYLLVVIPLIYFASHKK